MFGRVTGTSYVILPSDMRLWYLLLLKEIMKYVKLSDFLDKIKLDIFKGCEFFLEGFYPLTPLVALSV